MSFTYEGIVEYLSDLGLSMAHGFHAVFEFLGRELTIPDVVAKWWTSLFGTEFPLAEDERTVTILAVMFGGGLLIFLGYTIIKWILDVVL